MDMRKFILTTTITVMILFVISAGLSNKVFKEANKKVEVEKITAIEIKPTKTPYNFDGKYKNKFGAIWEIKGNQAKLYLEADGPENGVFDNCTESIGNDSKVLKYNYDDGTGGGYTILIYNTGKILFTDNDPKRNNLESDQFNKIK
jgi:hypothetical protein